MRKLKWPHMLLVSLTILASSPGGCDATTLTVTGRSVAPTEIVSVEGFDFVSPEAHSIQVDGGGWIDVSEQNYNRCFKGSEYPSCLE